MNMFLTIGLLLITAYIVGLLLDKIGLPKIFGYIATGIAFSPHSMGYISSDILISTQPLMDICLAFIAFQVGGSLKWSKIKRHEKEIISITLLASFIPYVFIALGLFAVAFIFPAMLPYSFPTLLTLALLLGALASPTEPAATLAVMHQYKARGKVSDTIMGVAALDDVVGILLFSLTIGIGAVITSGQEGFFENAILNSLSDIFIAVLLGIISALIMVLIAKIFKHTSDGQWVVTLFALIVLCVGASQLLNVDGLLTCMVMGVVVVNKCEQQKVIFRLLERYSEELIFLIFFLLSGLHLNISSLPNAVVLILIFVLMRILGKYVGASAGARMVHANTSIQRYTGGGLLSQGGIVIGLALSISEKENFNDISDILLTTIMGATIINELIGPLAAKYTLLKAGEIKKEE